MKTKLWALSVFLALILIVHFSVKILFGFFSSDT